MGLEISCPQALESSLKICSLFGALSEKKSTSKKLKAQVCATWGHNCYFLNDIGNTSWEIGIKASQRPLKFCQKKVQNWSVRIISQLRECRTLTENTNPLKMNLQSKVTNWGFPGGTVVENLPANAGDTGSSPGLGGSHMPRSGWALEPQLLSLRVWSLCSATREVAAVRGPRTAMKSNPRSPQLEKALA